MKEEILGDVSAKESKCFIQLVQEIIFFSRMMRLCLSSHCHPKKVKLVVGDLHICPPINIVEGCKDPGYKNWGIHQTFFWTDNYSTSYVDTCMYHYKNTINLQLCQNQAFHLDMYTFLGSVMLTETSLDKSRVSNAHFEGFMWKPSCFWCTMEIR